MHIQILTVVDPCYSLAAIYWCSAQLEPKWTLGYLSYISIHRHLHHFLTVKDVKVSVCH